MAVVRICLLSFLHQSGKGKSAAQYLDDGEKKTGIPQQLKTYGSVEQWLLENAK